MHDIIVIGASAGGVEALQELALHLPAGLRAAVFVVVHFPPVASTRLPEILSRAGPIPAMLAWDGAPMEHGRILIAPPNHHLLLESNHVHLSAGPRENRHRPAINPLFRSAAQSYAERVVGVILSGVLDDGVAGLWEIKRHGGVAIAQHPSEARYPDMPLSALRDLDVDYNLRVREIGATLERLAAEPVPATQTEARRSAMESSPTNLTCPECRGALEELRNGNLVEFRCRVGHLYSTQSVLTCHRDALERKLWAALVAMEEGAELADRFAATWPDSAGSLRAEAEAKRKAAADLRRIVRHLNELSAVRED